MPWLSYRAVYLRRQEYCCSSQFTYSQAHRELFEEVSARASALPASKYLNSLQASEVHLDIIQHDSLKRLSLSCSIAWFAYQGIY